MLENLIVIDANFILLPFQFKIDYLYEIDASLEGKTIFIVYKQILDELEAKKIREPEARKFHMNFNAGLLYLEKNNEKYNIDYKQNIKLKDVVNKLKNNSIFTITLLNNDMICQYFFHGKVKVVPKIKISHRPIQTHTEKKQK